MKVKINVTLHLPTAVDRSIHIAKINILSRETYNHNFPGPPKPQNRIITSRKRRSRPRAHPNIIPSRNPIPSSPTRRQSLPLFHQIQRTRTYHTLTNMLPSVVQNIGCARLQAIVVVVFFLLLVTSAANLQSKVPREVPVFEQPIKRAIPRYRYMEVHVQFDSEGRARLSEVVVIISIDPP